MSGVVAENFKKAFIVPGLPHLAFDTPGWQELKVALARAGEEARAANPDVLVIYSAQWISVLGHSFQADPNPQGVHVDENWYDMGDFEFNFKVDVELSKLAEQVVREKGFATKLINYEGFPIDTGTLVVMKYFNPDNKIPVMIVSSNIYASPEDSMRLGEAIGEALKRSGKKAVLINCSSLSHRFITHDIKPGEDHIASEKDDQWNRKMLDLIKAGKTSEILAKAPEYIREVNPEMQFKGFYWLMGVLNKPEIAGDVLAYGPLWGTGAAVVEYSLNN
jgi:2-aminophenol/2-amino-5-chlorophenol 1,6-dioxygenase alpha subunit